MDNYAYYLRAAEGDPFDLGPLVEQWSKTYDMVVRLHPDIDLRPDGVRSTSDEFRDEIEKILDEILPGLIPERRTVDLNASEIDDRFDWWPLAERLAALMEQPLYAAGVPKRRSRRQPRPQRAETPQMDLDF
jgi:hypothetical protein